MKKTNTIITAEQQILINELEKKINESISQNREEHKSLKIDQAKLNEKIDLNHETIRQKIDCLNETMRNLPTEFENQFSGKWVEKSMITIFGSILLILITAILKLIIYV
jgi:predicted nuclease with TOPRIM domain